jgi:hypothetical protein
MLRYHAHVNGAQSAAEAADDLHMQDAAALARLRARLKLTPGERWELWQASMRALEGWRGAARSTGRVAGSSSAHRAR